MLRARFSARGTVSIPPRPPTVFVADSSPAVQTALKEKLAAEGLLAYLARSPETSNLSHEFIGALGCALMTLSGNEDAIAEAQLLRVYQPELPIAFLHARASEHTMARAKEMGPIFHRDEQLDAAVAWAADRARR
jgi:hypothetical protein